MQTKRFRGWVTVHRVVRGPALARSPDYDVEVADNEHAVVKASEEVLRLWRAAGQPIDAGPDLRGIPIAELQAQANVISR